MQKTKYQQKSASSPQEDTQQSQPRRYNNTNTRSYNNTNNYSNNYNNNNYRKQRFENQQSKIKSRFGFTYDESTIGYNTEIPEMPEKPKTKPDDTRYTKKVEELQNRVTELKKSRKQKKQTYKNGNKGIKEQIEDQKRKINLARACLVILNFDKDQLQREVQNIESKIDNQRRKIDNLNKPNDRQGGKNLKIEEMDYAQLLRLEQRVTNDISTMSLTKCQQVDLYNKLQKISKRKLEVPQKKVDSNTGVQKVSQLQSLKESVQRLRHVRQNMSDKITDIDSKIEAILENVQDFNQSIEELHEKQRNTDSAVLLQEAQKLKKQIVDIWDELAQLKQQQDAKVKDYQYEQEKIKYISWAKDIKTKKTEEWQIQKQERKRIRLKEKDNQKKGDQKDQKTGKQGQNAQENKPEYQRKKINRNQKEIDACAFLIQYCKDLNAGSTQNDNKSSVKNEVKLQEVLKKGQWAKMKNVQVIQSKKKKLDEQVEHKTYKKKQVKNLAAQTIDRFSHTYFVAQIFDTVKVLPPLKQEQLEKTLTQLQDKMQYYIAHPDEGVDKSLLPQGRQSERETKSKISRRIINTEQFPSLR